MKLSDELRYAATCPVSSPGGDLAALLLRASEHIVALEDAANAVIHAWRVKGSEMPQAVEATEAAMEMRVATHAEKAAFLENCSEADRRELAGMTMTVPAPKRIT